MPFTVTFATRDIIYESSFTFSRAINELAISGALRAKLAITICRPINMRVLLKLCKQSGAYPMSLLNACNLYISDLASGKYWVIGGIRWSVGALCL